MVVGGSAWRLRGFMHASWLAYVEMASDPASLGYANVYEAPAAQRLAAHTTGLASRVCGGVPVVVQWCAGVL